MNVLQAVEELNNLKDKCKVLDLAIEKFKQEQKSFENISSYEIQLLTEISDEYEVKVERLQHQLESTPLTTMRDGNLIGTVFGGGSVSTTIDPNKKYEVK